MDDYDEDRPSDPAAERRRQHILWYGTAFAVVVVVVVIVQILR